ncbi:MAG: hypothetical protein QOG46_1456, partial [Pseudonocardiales bacterium]|nr:hypothetical protein [Pseudonocardiales bacterium]
QGQLRQSARVPDPVQLRGPPTQLLIGPAGNPDRVLPTVRDPLQDEIDDLLRS